MTLELKLAARGLHATSTGPIVLLALAGATFAVAIGFAFVRTVLLSPLPFRDADRVAVVFSGRSPGSTTGFTSSSWSDFEVWRDNSASFARLTAQLGFPFHLVHEGGAEEVGGLRVTGGYFELLGASAERGRLFTAADYRDQAAAVVVLSHDTWRRRFGADPGIVGRAIRLEDLSLAAVDPTAATREHTVIGVTAARFWAPRFWNDAYRTTELWVPFRESHDMGAPDLGVFDVVGRLATGVGAPSAEQELRALETASRDYDPADPPGVRVLSVSQQITGAARFGLEAVLVAAALLMTVACTNTGILLGARALGRTRELRTLAALGAPPGRLAALLTAEAGLLATAGALLGLFAAGLALPMIVAALPVGLPRVGELELRTADAFVAVTATLSTVSAFGALPAWLTVRARVLSRQGGSLNGGRGLLALQVALGVVLFVGTVTAARTLGDLNARPLGFTTEGRLGFGVAPPPARYPDDAARLALADELLRELRIVPGIVTAELARNLPLDLAWSAELAVDADGEARDVTVGKRNVVTAGYHRALGVPVLAGRTVANTDTSSTEPVVVLNRLAAERLFASGNGIGWRLYVDGVERTVVGVVGDTAGSALGPPVATAYLPFGQVPQGRFHVLLELEPGSDAAVFEGVRSALARVDPQLPLLQPQRLAEHVDRYRSPTRFLTASLSALSAVALLILVVGSLGVAGVEATARLREVAIRRAVGSTRGRLLSCLLRRPLLAVSAGAMLGALGALGLSRALARLAIPVTASWMEAALGASLVAAFTLVAAAVRFQRATKSSPAELLQR